MVTIPTNGVAQLNNGQFANIVNAGQLQEMIFHIYINYGLVVHNIN